MRQWIERLLPVDELIETVKRFPLSVLCALAMFVLALSMVHDIIDEKEEYLGRIFSILGCCYFWFGISKLIAESQGWNTVKYAIVSGVVAVALFVLFWFSTLWGIHLIFVIPALLLGLMFAPYLTGGDDISVWFFNRMMWFGVIVSYVALFMFAGGLTLALGAIHTLFDVKIEEEVYADIWLFASMVLGPLYALSWVPKSFTFTEDDCYDPPGLRFIANWITVPMVFVYLLILYAYFIKIVMTGEVPNGMLAYMISGFAGAGIVTYLIAWPMRETGTWQLRLFFKIFFPLLLIPVGFHFYAIWERVSAYGITEQRYMVLLSALWFAIMAFSNTMSKIPIKAIPATLCVLMIFASFGPWGGVSISGMSQFSRLEKLLIKHNLLQDDEIVKTEETIPFEDRLSISSILDYLCQSERDSFIEPWFKEIKSDNRLKEIKSNNAEKGWSCSGGYKLTEKMGFDYVSRWRGRNNTNERFYLNPQYKNYVDVSNYDMMVTNISVYHRSKPDRPVWSQEKDIGEGQKLKIEFDNRWLKLYVDNYNPAVIDMNLIVKDNVSAQSNSQIKVNAQELYVEGQNDHVLYRLNFRSISGQIKEETPEVSNLSFDFLYRIKE